MVDGDLSILELDAAWGKEKLKERRGEEKEEGIFE